jgi:cell division protein FtsA
MAINPRNNIRSSLRNNLVVALDIGTTKLVVMIGMLQPDGTVEVIGLGTSQSRGLRKGVVINIESTVESISRAVEQAETMAGVEISSVFAAIAGGHIKGFNSHGIVAIKNREVSPSDVERVIEAAKAVAIPPDREVLHVLPQEFIIDEQDGIKEPIGMSGVRLEARVHIVTGAVASAQNVVKCANRCGLSVKDIVLSQLASSEAVLTPEEKELGVCILDIGGGTTDLLVFHSGAVRHSAVLAVGGNHLTNDIAQGLRTPISSAEEIKCKYGVALTSLVRGDEIIEVPSTGGRPPRVLSKQVLSEIIEPRIEEIFSLVHREIARAGCENLLTSGLVLTGGAASMQGMCEVAEHIFNLPVRLGKPKGFGGLVDLVSVPEYATSVGLLLYGAQGAQNSRYNAPGQSFVKRALRRVNAWFGDGL